MGEFATAVQTHLRRHLADSLPALEWDTEHYIAGTPVDVAGWDEDQIVLLELEWRRADPSDNAAKLFPHLDSGGISRDQVDVFQLFTRYYNLASEGVSSKRENAEFVGRVAASAVDGVTYDPIDLDIDPPKRGGEWPGCWESAVEDASEAIARRL